MTLELRALLRRFPRSGRLEAIVLRPARGTAAVSVDVVQAHADQGLEGDRSALGPVATTRCAVTAASRRACSSAGNWRSATR
jgi:hypothetical protein